MLPRHGPVHHTPSTMQTLPITDVGTHHCLTAPELQPLAHIKTRTDHTTVLTHHTLEGALQMNVSDYQRVLGTYDRGWLNDTAITCTLRLFNRHSPPAGTDGSYICLDALFFTQLISPTRAYTYDNISKTTASTPFCMIPSLLSSTSPIHTGQVSSLIPPSDTSPTMTP